MDHDTHTSAVETNTATGEHWNMTRMGGAMDTAGGLPWSAALTHQPIISLSIKENGNNRGCDVSFEKNGSEPQAKSPKILKVESIPISESIPKSEQHQYNSPISSPIRIHIPGLDEDCE